MDSRICAVIPAYNEEKTIGDIVRGLKERDIDVIVVDDCSTDDTAGRALGAGATVIRFPRNQGPGEATRQGLIKALRQGYDVVVKFDGDAQFSPRYVDAIVKPIFDQAANAVIGERLSLCRDMPLHRRFGIRFLSIISSLIAGHRIRDSQSGIFAFSQNGLRELCFRWSNRWGYVDEVMFEVLARKLRTVFVSVPYRYQGTRGFYIKLSSYIPRILRVLIRSLFCRITGFYRYPWLLYRLLPKEDHMIRLYFSGNPLVRWYFWNRIVKSANIARPRGVVLDVGCGLGLISLFTEGFYVGLDRTRYLGRVYKALRILKENVHFVHADVRYMSFTKMFDGVYAVSVLEHLDSEEKITRGLKEIGKVIKDNGQLIVGLPTEKWFYRILASVFRGVYKLKGRHRFTYSTVIKMIEASGLFKQECTDKIPFLYQVSSWRFINRRL